MTKLKLKFMCLVVDYIRENTKETNTYGLCDEIETELHDKLQELS